MAKKTFITTSIAYINAEPHIGFLLELVGADVLARYHRHRGEDVFFLTGTDEHGQKIQQAIETAKVEPQQYADRISAQFEQLGQDFSVGFDYFVRTTQPKHQEFVQSKWEQLVEKGALEKRTYKGYYCVGCEAFKTERELENGKCTIHDQLVQETEEENWFFRLTDYKQVVLDWLSSGSVVKPESRLNEVRNMIQDLEDVSFSRPKDKLWWGIPVPGDDTQVMYVWADALLNYLSGIELSGHKIEEVWPADIQVIGKDILKFHAAIWPAMLHVLGYPLPKQLLVHGFINVNGKKLSKSTGNIVAPAELLERYGADATRYLLLRQLSFYEDSNFVWEEFDAIYNGELANGIGNLLNRTVSLAKKFPGELANTTSRIVNEVAETHRELLDSSSLKDADFSGVLSQANGLIKEADGWITENKPWTDLTNSELFPSLPIKSLCQISYLLEPFMPSVASETRRQLSQLDPKPLFPRLEKASN